MGALSIGTILSIASGFLKLANYIFEQVRNKAAEAVGEDREKLKQFTVLQELNTLLTDVDTRFAKMTDAEVKEEITKLGDWRD